MRLGLIKILNNAYETGELTRDEIVSLLSLEGDDIPRLLTAADQVRKEYCGEGVHLRGLIEFSNICSRNCDYCGLRRDNRRINRYRMTPQEIIDVSVGVAGKGLNTIVLQSGEDPWYTAERMTSSSSEISTPTWSGSGRSSPTPIPRSAAILQALWK